MPTRLGKYKRVSLEMLTRLDRHWGKTFSKHIVVLKSRSEEKKLL